MRNELLRLRIGKIGYWCVLHALEALLEGDNFAHNHFHTMMSHVASMHFQAKSIKRHAIPAVNWSEREVKLRRLPSTGARAELRGCLLWPGETSGHSAVLNTSELATGGTCIRSILLTIRGYNDAPF